MREVLGTIGPGHDEGAWLAVYRLAKPWEHCEAFTSSASARIWVGSLAVVDGFEDRKWLEVSDGFAILTGERSSA